MSIFTNKQGTAEYGYKNNVLVGPDDIVLEYDPQRKNLSNNGVDIGYFLVNKSAIPRNGPIELSFQNDILSNYCKSGNVSAYWIENQYYYITNFDSLNSVQRAFSKLKLLPIKL